MKRVSLSTLFAVLMGTAFLVQTFGLAGEFTPNRKIDFYISSAAGGSSDIFTRTIADICKSEGWVDQPFIVNNMPDGKGQIARMNVRDTRSPNHTLLCFSSGDFSAMMTTAGSDLKLADFVPVAILAADKHLIFAGKNGKYKSMEELVAGLKNGDQITIGGTKSDELTAFNMFVAELGYPDNFSYIMYEASSESITAIMGEHVDLAMGKPASGRAYVESGDIVPIVALASERFPAPFEKAPTMVDAGFNLVEFPVWRGVIASKKMSPEALKFWNDTFHKVTETERWKVGYLEKFLLAPNFKNLEETTAIMKATEQDIMKNL